MTSKGDTLDRVHGGRQLSLFHAHHDSRCFLPMRIYEAMTGKLVAVILRPGKAPDGAEVARVLRHLVKAIRRRWPGVEIVIRRDSPCARPEAMAFLERNRVHYGFGLAGNRVLDERTGDLVEDAAVRRAEQDAEKIRNVDEFRYAAKSWKEMQRRVIARIDVTRKGSDTRCPPRSVDRVSCGDRMKGLLAFHRDQPLRHAPLALRDPLLWSGPLRALLAAFLSGSGSRVCWRPMPENLIKAHKLHLASHRTACTKATANQFRLVVHTAAYWLLHTFNSLAPRTSYWRDAQFDTIRLAFVKVFARVSELVTRIKVSLPSSYPYKQSPTRLAGRAKALPP